MALRAAECSDRAGIARSDAPDAFVSYYRCVHDSVTWNTRNDLSEAEGFFRFNGATCFGRWAGGMPAVFPTGVLPETAAPVTAAEGQVIFPFDFGEIVENLRTERYQPSLAKDANPLLAADLVHRLYYFLRPSLPVGMRKHIQRLRLRDWDRIAFPDWPVDVTVETLMRGAIAAVLHATGLERMPFIWFWPDSSQSCVLMTHDVEGPAGLEFCGELMDLDESFGIRSSFQVVPEHRSRTSAPLSLVETLRRRGFEVNLHDLNHDGLLFRSRAEFVRRAGEINRLAKELGVRGFRSGAMYREQSWFEALDLSFDMSVPNAAHLEPQRGGCCTVMPYFVGGLLELPLTTTQDYSLFHILNEYSVRPWVAQMDTIRAHNGLISFITHPDYLTGQRERAVYVELLRRLAQRRSEDRLWIALPSEVDHWWRTRDRMRLVRRGDFWIVDGPESHRAAVAYAVLHNGSVKYELERAHR